MLNFYGRRCPRKLDYNQLEILIHPDSYIHAIVEFKNKMISIIAHDTTMDIPIYNSMYDSNGLYNNHNISKINLEKLNKLSLIKVNLNKFPVVKILKKMQNKHSLFETVIVAANDELVNLYLKKKIKYSDISSNLLKIIEMDKFTKFKKKFPKKMSDIKRVNDNVRLIINEMI